MIMPVLFADGLLASVTLGINIPIFVAETSSIASGSGGSPLLLMATWVKLAVEINSIEINATVVIRFFFK
jgi:hypothetical protein